MSITVQQFLLDNPQFAELQNGPNATPATRAALKRMVQQHNAQLRQQRNTGNAGQRTQQRSFGGGASTFQGQLASPLTDATPAERMKRTYLETQRALKELNLAQRQSDRQFRDFSFLTADSTEHTKKYGGALSEIKHRLGDVGIGYGEAAVAVHALHQGFSATRVESESNNRILAETIALNELQGIQSQESVRILDEQRRAFGMNTQEMIAFRSGVVGAADAIGQSLPDAFNTLRATQQNYMGNHAAVMGQFRQFQAFETASGVKADKLIGAYGQMAMTQQQAAQVVSKMNAYFGKAGGFISPQQLMAAKPAEKMNMVLQQIRRSGVNIKEMLDSGDQRGVMMLNFLKSTGAFGGLSQNEIAGLVRMSPEEVNQYLAKTKSISGRTATLPPGVSAREHMLAVNRREAESAFGMMSPEEQIAARAKMASDRIVALGTRRLVGGEAGPAGDLDVGPTAIQGLQGMVKVVPEFVNSLALAGSSIASIAGTFKVIAEALPGNLGKVLATVLSADQIGVDFGQGAGFIGKDGQQKLLAAVAKGVEDQARKLNKKAEDLPDSSPLKREAVAFQTAAKKAQASLKKAQDAARGRQQQQIVANKSPAPAPGATDVMKKLDEALKSGRFNTKLKLSNTEVAEIFWNAMGGNLK